MRSYTKQERPLLSDATRRKREERVNALVNRLKGVDAGATLLFSDEKFFTLAQYHNRRNSHVVLRQGEVSDLRVQGVAQRPAGVMFLGVVASDGRVGPPIFVEAGVKIDSLVYQDSFSYGPGRSEFIFFGCNNEIKAYLKQNSLSFFTFKYALVWLNFSDNGIYAEAVEGLYLLFFNLINCMPL